MLPQVRTPREFNDSRDLFGTRIRTLRLARGVTQRELARSVSLTPEHLSRIERGRRPPPRRGTVLRLAEALGASTGDEVSHQLLTAAGYAPEPIIQRADTPVFSGDGFDWMPRGSAAVSLFAQLPAAIEGSFASAQAALHLLRAAAAQEPAGNGTVSLTLTGASQALLSGPEMHHAWYAALRGLLSRGWRFRHLWQLGGGVSWPSQIIAELSALAAWPTRYEPFYLRDGETDQLPQDLLVVPGIGALSGLTTGRNATEAALVVRDHDQVRALSEHISRLLRGAQPLLTTSLIGDRGAPGNASRIEFTEVLAGAHEEMGEHRLVKSGIPLRFVPSPSWWQMALHDLPAGGTDQRRHSQELAYRRRLWECRQRVRRVLAAEMRVSRHREICSTHGLRRFAEDGIVSSDDFLLDGLPPLSREERADALLRLLGQLNSNPNYELALLDKDPQQLASVMWVVKGARFFCLEAVHRGADEQRQDFMAVITDKRLVTGFRDYFDNLWESLPARWRDKPRVEHWLDRQIELLH